MSLRITEIGENPVAHEPGNMAAIMRDYGRAGRLKPPDHTAQILGIELDGERRRAYDIAKQHCRMMSLRFGLGRCNVCERPTLWK